MCTLQSVYLAIRVPYSLCTLQSEHLLSDIAVSGIIEMTQNDPDLDALFTNLIGLGTVPASPSS